MSNDSQTNYAHDVLPIAVRAYNEPQELKEAPEGAEVSEKWSLVFDTETTADHAQSLRFGTYQVRKYEKLDQSGIFIERTALSDKEIALITGYAATHHLTLITKDEFVEKIFFDLAYERGAMVVGFNLPFDLSRLAIKHARARGRRMYGGFSLKLSPYSYRPRIRIKHLTKRAAIIDFSKPDEQKTPRSMRKKLDYVPPKRGFFLDLKTISAALTSRSHSLKSLARDLGTDHQKETTDEHGLPIDESYLSYAVTDTQVTWECYEKLSALYKTHALKAPIESIYSEAGIGKAYLSQMGIKPWRVVQPDFPSHMTGIIMSTFYGGRSEVKLRRVLAPTIHCDFLSMYPTICSLMGLWRWVISTGVDYEDSTSETMAFLERISKEDMLKLETWKCLNVIVQVIPDNDMAPVRSQYPKADGLVEADTQFTTGLNYLKSGVAIWLTLADCLISKISTGKVPRVIRAYKFIPRDIQPDLQEINIAGDPSYRVNPIIDDFYKRLIEMRIAIKADANHCLSDSETVKTAEGAIKILANSTAYGIFVEVNVRDLCKPQITTYRAFDGNAYETSANQLEEPGKFFHPIIGSFITGGARLMLALAEVIAKQNNLGWILCDTDSMAFTPPEGMQPAEFSRRVEIVRQSFAALNPYNVTSELLKLEKINFFTDRTGETNEIIPLYCYAVSAKRYVMFNLDENGLPIIRKASAHGLGHLYAPYEARDAFPTLPLPIYPLDKLRDKIGVTLWQHDHWYRIIMNVLGKSFSVPEIDSLLNQPAVIRYGANTPDLLDWFKSYNKKRAYKDQVKPFNFLFSLQAHKFDLEEIIPEPGKHLKSKSPLKPSKAAAPFDKDIRRALQKAFDRNSGNPISLDRLQTYARALAQFHLHPEAKFQNGSYTDHGPTSRRHVRACEIVSIGKEANRLEQRMYLGDCLGDPNIFGSTKTTTVKFKDQLQASIELYGMKAICSGAKVSERFLRDVVNDIKNPSAKTRLRIHQTLSSLDRLLEIDCAKEKEVLTWARECRKEIGLRRFAGLIGEDPSNLAKTLNGQRTISEQMRGRILSAYQAGLNAAQI